MEPRTRRVRPQALDLEFEILEGDSVIGPAIEQGGWEAHESALFRAHLVPGARVLDLGANIGWFSTLAVLAGCQVHAFEPVPHIAEVCARNLERANAKGPGKAVLHRCAAAERAGRARIALSARNQGDNRVLDGTQRPSDMGEGETVQIELARVDDLVEGPVRVLKIDTQGSEWLALSGMPRVLAASPQLALLLEFWPYALRGAQPGVLLDFLEAQGFTLGKATAAPYPMRKERILRQALARDPVKGGLDLYGTRGLPFHALGLGARLHGMWRAQREE
ncbi:MAG: FkbM family methyltransferase [Planctomycetes bacterium]|nr:FkbM family methyltransferase [Planctomycetota bacterium]